MKRVAIRARVLCVLFGLTGFAPAVLSAADFDDLVTSCESCHGKDGASKDEEIATIGGLSATYITDSFTAYRDKTRPCEEVKYLSGPHKGEAGDMCKVTEKLSPQEIKKLAEHFAAKPFVRASQGFDPTLAKVGKGVHKLNCVKCHEDGGSSPADDAGILAGQWLDYLRDQFEAFESGKREMPKKMKKKMDKMSKEDINALLQYYASFQ